MPCAVLQDLARRSNLRQGVSCVVFDFDIQPHDLTQKEQAPGSVTTMLDVLQCAVWIDPRIVTYPNDDHLACVSTRATYTCRLKPLQR